jgi:polyphosphate kinase
MKRLGGLKQQVAAEVRTRTPDGRTPSEQIAECVARITVMEEAQQAILESLLEDMCKEGIEVSSCDELGRAERTAVREDYIDNIFPLVTPHAMSPAQPFPFVSNLSINLLVTLRHPGDELTSLARVKVPLGDDTERFLRVGRSRRYVALEDVMAHNLDLLFPGMEIIACERFRVTRNANTERDEDEADDLLALIRTELRDRKLSPIVRLQVQRDMNPTRRGMLAAELGLDEPTEVSEVQGMMGVRDLWQLSLLDAPELKDDPHHPVDIPLLHDAANMFHTIRDRGSVLVHHPYECFDSSVMRFLKEAAQDPKVRAIKMTVYRSERKVISRLIEAARNGKQVTVVVEIKARFDEAANLRWVERLEEYGINVTYGVVGLKTHCKAILVVRRDYDRLRRYTHIGTGNYHPRNSRIYGDLGLFTIDPDIGHDINEVFNYLTTGIKPNRKYRRLLVAPKAMRKVLLDGIRRETEHHKESGGGLIQFKCNALEDPDVVDALYDATRTGVQVDLLVRDTCRFRPGVPELSASSRVVSVIGRFLEHARVYYFRNAGDEEYFIGSADCMSRNLTSRVEVLTPVDDPEWRDELRNLIDTMLADNCDAWDMNSDGTYSPRGEGLSLEERRQSSAQLLLQRRAEKRVGEARRLRKRKMKRRDPGLS